MRCLEEVSILLRNAELFLALFRIRFRHRWSAIEERSRAEQCGMLMNDS